MESYYAHESLKESENTLYHILDIIPDGIWDWNALTGKVERSPGWYRMLDYDINSFEKDVYTWENIIHPDDYPRVMKHFEAYINGKIDSYSIKYRCKKSDGTYLWIKDSGKIIEYTSEGNASRMIGAHTNINDAELSHQKLKEQNELLLSDNLTLENIIEKRTRELKSLNRQLEYEMAQVEYHASYDIVTGIYNRRKFEEVLHKEIQRAKRYSHPLSIILVDIDDFKNFNDCFGHKIGDEVLLKVAVLLKENIRDIDSLARWGGDEFSIILPNTSEKNTEHKVEILKEKIRSELMIEDKRIMCSFGVTSYIEGDDSTTIFMRADKKLYLAKKNK